MWKKGLNSDRCIFQQLKTLSQALFNKLWMIFYDFIYIIFIWYKWFFRILVHSNHPLSTCDQKVHPKKLRLYSGYNILPILAFHFTVHPMSSRAFLVLKRPMTNWQTNICISRAPMELKISHFCTLIYINVSY